jgi:hypothetical protein
MGSRKFQVMVGLALASSILATATTARAFGMGAYFEYGRGMVEQQFGVDFDQNLYGGGFALDTAVARDRLFNYRLNFGYQRTSRESTVGPFPNANLNGFEFNQMFGIGALRSRNVRLWFGPSLRLSFDFVSEEVPGIDAMDLGIGGGVAAGINLHTGNAGSATFTFGYQYLYTGEFVYGSATNVDVLNGGQQLLTFNFGYLFRSTGDRFLPRKRGGAGQP